MEAKGIGPKALSLKAGLNETYVRDLLKGRSLNPRQSHLQKLAEGLDCGVSDLTGESATVPAERELLAAFRSTDEQGQAMMLRLGRSLRRDDPPADEAAAAARPSRRATGCVVPVMRVRGKS
jgi:transcriptional regulator with XRE-family HTH domain